MNLSVQALCFSYDTAPLLRDIRFSLDTGSFVCVLGENGAGKSTLFQCILNLQKNYTGQISLDGQNIKTLNERELAKSIAYIPQLHKQSFPFSVFDTVLMGTAASLSPFSTPKDTQKEAAMEALRLMGMEKYASRSFSHLSGGEQQMVLIARALAQKAPILIMDEPCSNLDYGNQIRLLKKLKQLSALGYLVLLSTHNPEHAFLFADNVLVLHNGNIMAQGNPREALTASLLEEIYRIPIQLYTSSDVPQPVCIPKI